MNMAFRAHCPRCEAGVKVGDKLLGKRISCPSCKHAFVVANQEAALQVTAIASNAPSQPPQIDAQETFDDIPIAEEERFPKAPAGPFPSEPPPAPAPAEKPGSSNNFFGTLFVIAAGIAFLVACAMDTSVPTGTNFGSVQNIGLLNVRQNYVMVGGACLVSGIILFAIESLRDKPRSGAGGKSIPW